MRLQTLLNSLNWISERKEVILNSKTVIEEQIRLFHPFRAIPLFEFRNICLDMRDNKIGIKHRDIEVKGKDGKIRKLRHCVLGKEIWRFEKTEPTSGSDIITWLRRYCSLPYRKLGLELAQELLDHGFLQPLSRSSTFSDGQQSVYRIRVREKKEIFWVHFL